MDWVLVIAGLFVVFTVIMTVFMFATHVDDDSSFDPHSGG